MGSRLLPLSLVLGALAADGGGVHRLSFYLVLLAVVGAAAAAFVAVGDYLAGHGSLAASVSCSLAVVALLVGSALRSAAAVGAGIPVLAVSTLVMAAVLYTLPLWGWLFAPLPRVGLSSPQTVRTE
jgi:hypothetical protein